jgi:hypothetical protein
MREREREWGGVEHTFVLMREREREGTEIRGLHMGKSGGGGAT